MRPIKFRAWDEEKKTMLNDFNVAANDGHITKWGPDDDHFCNIRLHGLELMQFTGLLDKKKKEVYEGDQVVIPDTFTETVDVGVGSVPVAQTPENHIATVKFVEGEFVFVVEESADVLLKGEYTWRQLKDEVGIDEIEVIGNIYES